MGLQSNQTDGERDLQKVLNILRDYPADRRDGFVSNIDSYAEQKCKEAGVTRMLPEVKKLMHRMG